MEVGKYVRVYFDPLTCTEMEGDAKLIKYIGLVGEYDGRRLERWKVRFRGETGTNNRNILAEPEPTLEPETETTPEAENTDGSRLPVTFRETDL